MKNAFQKHHLHCEICQQYYSIKSLALMWDMSQRTVKRMIERDELRAKRIGGSWRIPHSEVAKVIND